MNSRIAHLFTFTAVVCLPFRFAQSAVAAPELRYQFKAGSNYVYSIRIEATEPDYVETVTGTATYAVKSATADGITFTTRSSLQTQRKSKSGSIMPGIIGGPPSFRAGGFRLGEFGMPAGPFARANEVMMDTHGQVLQESGRSQLPQALGDLSHLVTDPLPTAGKIGWEIASDCMIVLEEKEFTSPGSRIYRIKDVRLPAKERTTFVLGTATGDTVPILRKYELKTVQTVAGQPRMAISGEGTNLFSLKLGLISAVEFKGTITDNTENTTIRVPLTLSCKLLTGEELVAAQKAATAGVPKLELKPLSAEDRATLTSDLKGDNKSRRTVAMSRLAIAQADGNRSDIATTLVDLLKDSDQFTRQSAARALGTWGTASAVDALITRLGDDQFAVRWAVMDALGRLKDMRAAEPLSKFIISRKDHFQAGNALKAMGDIVEPTVWKLLEEKTPEVRREACQILQAIGTKKSVLALEAASKDSDSLVSRYAKDALKIISER